MPSNLARELLSYGARPEQLVELTVDSPRALLYADLKIGDDNWSPPVVAEHEHVPRMFVFDGRTKSGEVSKPIINQWCRRILLRGDPAWTAVLRPGRLDILSFEIQGNDVVASKESIDPNSGGLARFIHDVRSGVADLPRRAYLKDLLSQSMQQAVDLGVSPIDAVSLVGWGLFWRFLVDRKLLVRKAPGDIAEGAESWTDCLSTKGRALKTLKWLDTTFNGGLLPFETSPKHYAPEVFSQVLGNIAAGATAQGQLRLPTDWNEINFAHVPVGLLSEVYEAFATALDAPAAKKRSIHYTPRHIAEFVVGEALSGIRDIDNPRVLDPAVGAGVFLIATFRHLVQREWERTQVRPKRRQIRRILSNQLAAFDVDQRALRLARLGLYLTALELDPSPTPVEDLKFDDLEAVLRWRNEVDGSLAAVAEKDAGRYDLVIGNPPWTGHDKAAKRRWVANTGTSVLKGLRPDADSFDLPDANPDLAFLWRAGEWAKPGGQIALVVHARWLFGLSDRLVKARDRIFSAFNVTGILNGTALRLTAVWPNVTAPFCLLFARNDPAPAGGAFQFVSPFVEASDAKEQTVLRVDWSDAQAVSHDEVRSTPWALKARFRGDPLARRAFEIMHSTSVPLGEYLSALNPNLRFRNGYQVGGKAGKQHSATHLLGMPDLKGTAADAFLIETSVLPAFSRKTLLRPRNRAIYEPPLLLVRETIPVDPFEPRAVRAESSVVYHQSYHGLSFADIPDGKDRARLLQLLLQSRVTPFVSLLMDARFGVERDTIYQESLAAIPVIPLERLTRGQLSQMRQISKEMEKGLDKRLFERLNVFVCDLYGLGFVERQAIEDTLETRGPTPASVGRAVAAPTQAERLTFLAALKESLDDVLQASGLRAIAEEVQAGGIPWRVLSIATRPTPALSFPMDELLREADESGASLVVLPMSRSHVFVGLPDRYRHWTRTQAVLLAHELLGGALSDG